MKGRPKTPGKRYIGEPCHRGHTERYISNGGCCQCNYESTTRRNGSPGYNRYMRAYQQRQRRAAKQETETCAPA
jgi:hypothetical protein